MTNASLPLVRAARSGAAIVTAQIGVSILTFFLGVATAATFGAGGATDAYFMAASTAELLSKLLLGGALTSVLLPTFVGHLTRNDPERAARLCSGLFTLALVAFVVFGGALELLAAPLLQFLAPGFSAETRMLATVLLRVVLPAYVFSFLSDIVTVPLHAHRRFGLPAATRMFVPALSLGVLLALTARIGILTLALGTLAGTLLQFGVLFGAVRRAGVRLRLALPWRMPEVWEVVRLTLPFALSILAAYGAGAVYRILVSNEPEGSLASLKFAEKIFQMANVLFLSTVTQVAFPVFSRAVARGVPAEIVARLRTAVRVVLFVGVPITVGIILLREPLVRVLYERGAFTPAASATTALLVPLYMVGLLGNGISSLLGHVALALRQTRLTVAVNVALQAIAASLFVLLVPSFGIAGLALVSGIGPFILTALYLWTLRAHVPRLGTVFAGPGMLHLVVAGAACAAAVFAVQRALGLIADPFARDVARLASGAAAGFAAYVAAAAFLRVPEVDMVKQLAQHVIRRAS